MKMSELAPLIGPLLGMLGVVVGGLLNEFLRKGRRVEEYSTGIREAAKGLRSSYEPHSSW